jgi:hypothetical protein
MPRIEVWLGIIEWTGFNESVTDRRVAVKGRDFRRPRGVLNTQWGC